MLTKQWLCFARPPPWDQRLEGVDQGNDGENESSPEDDQVALVEGDSKEEPILIHSITKKKTTQSKSQNIPRQNQVPRQMVIPSMRAPNSMTQQNHKRNLRRDNLPHSRVERIIVLAGHKRDQVQQQHEPGGVEPEIDGGVDKGAGDEAVAVGGGGGEEGRGFAVGFVEVVDDVAEGVVGEEDYEGGEDEVVFGLDQRIWLGYVPRVVNKQGIPQVFLDLRWIKPSP